MPFLLSDPFHPAANHPQRTRAQSQRLEDEQTDVHMHAGELLHMGRALRLSTQPARYMSNTHSSTDRPLHYQKLCPLMNTINTSAEQLIIHLSIALMLEPR